MKRTCCSWMSVRKLACPSLNLSFPLHSPIQINEGHVFAPLYGKLTGNHVNTFGLFGWLRLGLCTGAFSGPPKMLLVGPPGGTFFCGWAGGSDSPKIPLVFPPEWRDRNKCYTQVLRPNCKSNSKSWSSPLSWPGGLERLGTLSDCSGVPKMFEAILWDFLDAAASSSYPPKRLLEPPPGGRKTLQKTRNCNTTLSTISFQLFWQHL